MALGQRPGVSVLRLAFFSLCFGSTFTSAYLEDNGLLTQGLAILGSPAPQSQAVAGGSLDITIDLSGNGILQLSSYCLPSSSPRAYQSLDIYLVSSFINVNVTVSEGPIIFQQEPTSMIKHITWAVPSCLPGGNYNLTLYEASRIDQGSCYSITPIPIVIESNSTAICIDFPPADPQPQPSSPPLEQPWSGEPIASETPFSFPTTNPGESGALPTASQLSGSNALSTSGSITPALSSNYTTITPTSSTMALPISTNGMTTVFTSATSSPSPSTVGVFVPINVAARVGSSISLTLYGLITVFIGRTLWVYIDVIHPM